MASFVCYGCSKDLKNTPKDRVLIRQKTKEYAFLFDLVLDIIKSSSSNVVNSLIHDKLDGVLCKGCWKCLSKFFSATMAIEPFKNKLYEMFNIPTKLPAISSSSTNVAVIQEVHTPPGSSTSCNECTSLINTPMRKRRLDQLEENDDISTVETPVKRIKFQQVCERVKNNMMKSNTNSPPVCVVIGYDKNPKVRELSLSLRRLGKSISRGKREAIAKAAVDNPTLLPHIVACIARKMRLEMANISSLKHSSILRMKSKVALERFTWDRVWTEIKTKSPLLAEILKKSLPPHVSEKSKVIPSLCVCASILLKTRNSHINVVQGMISLLLKSSNGNKQLFRRLQKASLCLSYDTTLNMMNVVAEGYDEQIDSWKNSLQYRVRIPECDVVQGPLYEESPPISSSIETPVFSPIQSISTAPSSPKEIVNSPDKQPNGSTPSPPENLQCNIVNNAVDSDQNSINNSPLTGQSDAWNGYVLATDNLDRNIRPRHQTLTSQTVSMHWSNAIAVQDRCDFSGLADEAPLPSLSSVDVNSFLFNKDDFYKLLRNLSIIVGRVLVQYLPSFSKYASLTESHIHHSFSSEMSTRSKVIPLGLILKNPATVADMVEILEEHQQFVPVSSITISEDVPGQDEKEVISIDSFHKILGFGDQLTVERMRCAQLIRANSESGIKKLQGFVPAISDWHVKVSLLGTIYKRLYKDQSLSDGGTLAQIRHLINRTNVPAKPKQNVNAAEEFFDVTLTGHLIAAALCHFKMEKINDEPQSSDLSEINRTQSLETKKELFHSAIYDMITSYINIPTFDDEDNNEELDGVRAYAKELLTLGLVLMEFNDSVHEGDGQRLLRVWKLLMLVFRSTGKTKYSLEALVLQIQTHVLPDRLKQQILYSRFVNTKGKPGKNIPIDLHLEHINRIVKSSIHNQASNLKPTAIKRTSRCTGALTNVIEQFDKITELHSTSSTHSKPKIEKDISRIVKQLHEVSKVFHNSPGRKHSHFNYVKGSIIKPVISDKEKIVKWIKGHLNKYYTK